MATGFNLTRATHEGVNELRRRNAELEARVAALDHALQQVEADSRRAAGAAHDIRNALMVIVGEADLLVRNLRDPEQVESARAIKSAARIVASLTRQMVVSAQAQWKAGGVLLEPAPANAATPERTATAASEPRASDGIPVEVNSGELMLSARVLIERMLQPGVGCVFAVEPGLWPIAVPPQQLEAALLNLVSNARDAMPAGGKARIAARNVPSGTLLPRGLSPGSYVGFSVEDTGVGMSASVLAKATEAFFTTKPRDRGTGLGLAMVHALATEAGGTLHLESEVGRGTRAEILLPRAPQRSLPLPATDARFTILDRMRLRVRTPWLTELIDGWSQCCDSGGLPRPSRLESLLEAHSACSLVLAVELGSASTELRLVRMGQDLVRCLERSALHELGLNGPDVFGSLATTYRRALRSRCPNYQFVRHAFGHGEYAQLERIVLPAAIDGEAVSHLFGVVLLTSNFTEAHPLTENQQ